MQKVHIQSFLCLLLVLLPLTSNAQKKITGYRYWFDNDITTLQNKDIESDGCQMTLDVKSMKEGIHTLSIMFKDSEGLWSVPYSQPFYRTVSQSKSNAESCVIYFDGNASIQQTLTIKDGSINSDIDVSKMTDGMHTAHVIVKGSEGKWAVPCQQAFIKVTKPANTELLLAEYYFDSEYAPNIMQKAKDGTLSADVDVSTLTAGMHTINIRYLSTDGRWSTPYSQCFLKMPDLHAATADSVEYYFDNNANVRHTMALTGNSEIISELPTDLLSEGMHVLGIRFKDSDGRWSTPYSQCFYINRPVMLAGYEYWFNGKYDEKKKETLNNTKLGEGLKLNIDVSDIIAATSDDEPRCTLHLRFVTSRGEWSEVVVHEFTRASTEIALEDYEILKAFYKETGGDGWTNKWDISSNVISADNWYGVGFDQGRVYSLNLSGNNLTTPSRQLKETIFTLSALETLDLSKNDIEGDAGAILSKDFSANTALREIDLSYNRLGGDASVLANTLPSLKKANLSHNHLTDFDKLTNESLELDITSQFVNADNSISDDAPLYESELASAIRLDVPTIFTYDNGSTPNVMVSSPTGDELIAFTRTDEDEWLMDNIVTGEWHHAADEKLVITLKNGIAKGSKAFVKLSYPAGDANIDQKVDVTDLQSTILYIMEDYPGKLFNYAAANTHKDDDINVQDAVATINILLNQQPASQEQAARRAGIIASQASQERASEADEVVIYLKDGVIEMESTCAVAALHIQCNNAFAWEFADYGMQQSTKGGNVVTYSFDGTTLPLGRTAIGTYTSNPMLYDISASDAEARPLATKVVIYDTTNIDGAKADDNYGPNIYSTAGIRMNTLSNGVNIVKKHGRHVKVIKK